LQKSFLDPQHVISSLNNRGRNGSPHRLGASGSFRVLLFHAGLESGVTNSKKIEKMRDLRVASFYVTYMRETNLNLENFRDLHKMTLAGNRDERKIKHFRGL
jgi:hypothetical protein